MQATTQIEQDFVQLITQIGSASGLPSIQASMFAILYLAPQPISMDELAKKTGYSLASISLKIKLLENFGMVKRQRKPGSRKVFLFAKKQLFENLRREIEIKERNISLIKSHIPLLIQKFEAASLSKIEEAQLKNLKLYYEQADKMEKFIKKTKELLDNWDKK